MHTQDLAHGKDTRLAAIVSALRDVRTYPEGVQQLEAIETHRSWVFLTETHAYKLKKPVRTGVELEARARILRETSRIVTSHVTITQPSLQPDACFEGEYTFVVVDEAGAEKLLGRKLPDVWKRFAR